MKKLVKLLVSGITIFSSGCIQNYNGEFVMNPAGRAWTKTGNAYDESGAAFSQLKIGRGFVKGGEGLLRTLGSGVTTVNNTADLAIGCVTAPISYIGGPAEWPDDFRKTTLDSFIGGEDFNESFSFAYWHSPFTNSFYSAQEHHDKTKGSNSADNRNKITVLNPADSQGKTVVIDSADNYNTAFYIDGCYKTLIRFLPIVAVAAGGGGGGGGGSGGVIGPGPTPVDPF